MRRELIAKGLLITYMVVLLYLALGPAPSGPEIPHLDKLMHALSWGLMALLCLGAWPDHYLRAVFVSGLHGGATEVMQGTLVQGRTADWFDWLADLLGALLAIGLVSWARRRARSAA